MFCPKCGKKNDDEAKFCNSCGTSLSGKPTTQPTRASSGFSIGKFIGFAVLFVVLVVVLVAIFTTIYVVKTTPHERTASSTTQEQQVSGEKKSQKEAANDKKLHKKTFDDGTELVYGIVSNVVIAVFNAAEIQHPIGNKIISERPQGKFIGVYVCVQNNQNDAITIMGSNYALVDEKGREYTASVPAMSAWDMVHRENNMLTEVNPGNSVTFVCIFDVPRDADLKQFRLRAHGGMTGDSVDLPFNYNTNWPLE